MASEESRLEKLVNLLKSNDVDVKVDALTKLQAEFESGVEIADTDAVISAFKGCLRTPNQHLTNATLYALPPLLPLLITRTAGQPQPGSALTLSSSTSSSSFASGVVDVQTLRQIISGFLSSGGIIDRLGDKERAQLKAREALVLLGGFAFRTAATSTFSSKSGKGVETPMMMFERFLKETGLASKVWKVREQSILTLIHLRRAFPLFPIRPYSSLLVDCLEDTDAHVRDCARSSVIELFSGSGVTDAARADLKKEMTKKSVRKAIVENVLSKLLNAGIASNSQSQDGSENGEPSTSKPKEYVPPSLRLAAGRIGGQNNGLAKAKSISNLRDAARPSSRGAVPSPPPPPTPTSENAEVQAVYIASARDLENEFAAMAKPFEGKETEHNWAAREAAIQRVRGMLKGDVHTRYVDAFFASLKEGFMQWSLKALASLRTTVATCTCALYSELAVALGSSLDPYCDLLLTNLLKMAGFTKKIAAQQSQASVTEILTHTSSLPRVVLPLLWNTLQEKTVQARAFVVGHLKTYVEIHGNRSKNAIESSGGLEIMEKSIKKALADPNPAVRESARVMFWSFDTVWHDSAMTILNSLDATARKQLEKACPNPSAQLQSILPPTTPKVAKKSSIAAAIAASRAKAKAIAAAPPSLRHQATSSSHTPAFRRSLSPSTSTSPKPTFARPSSPLRTSSSPGSPSSPRARAAVARSISSTSVPPSRSPRAPSSHSSQRARSPSLSDHHEPGRRTSSPLATKTSNMNTLRKAMQTALPASPPSSQGQLSPTPRPPATLKNGPLPIAGRNSLLLPSGANGDDQSLLMAQTVPIPEGDSDSEDDHSINLLSFSAAYEKFPQSASKVFSLRSNDSKPTAASVSNALSSGSISDAASGQPVVEDALRARAEQAESAAERLLELVDDDDLQQPMMPIPLNNNRSSNTNGHSTAKVKTKPAPIPIARAGIPPVTPNARASTILRQAALFKDSPANNKRSVSLLDALQAQKHETGWWLKRTALFAKATPLKSKSDPERVQELQGHIAALESGEITKESLQRIALICLENTVADLSSPPPSPGTSPASPSPFSIRSPSQSLHSDMWEADRNFDRLFSALMKYLEPTRAEFELEYGLIIVWEMLENQAPYLEGREADLFSMLLQARYCNKVNVLEAASTIRDALTSKIDPVYGLTTFHACLRAFHAEPCPDTAEDEVKAATYAFGLIALGKFILRLPAEIAEEELPRLKGTLISALNDRSSLIVRESAAASIIAAQLVLRDEAHLFALLDGLADDKKNLLTYLFDKHGARGSDVAANGHSSGMVKLEKEIRRLDTRMSTPLRGPLLKATPGK